MHYSERPGNVRVDFFKASGKWYTTEAVDMEPFYEMGPVEGLQQALRVHLSDGRLRDMTAVCLEPYSRHSYPVMIKDWGAS